MKITRLTIESDGSEVLDTIEIEDPVEVEPVPTEEEDTAAMLVDHEYRLTLLELGITESEV